MASSEFGQRVRGAVAPAGRRALRSLPESVRRPLGRQLVRSGLAAGPVEDHDHPERLAVLDHVVGSRILEIGCGPRKTSEHFIGLDLTPGGSDGSVGNAEGRASQADICADGSALPVATDTVDCVVARHNLEHYVDTIATLREWERVLVPGGRLVAVVPDEDAYPGRTVELDPTHYHSFNEASVRGLLGLLGWTVSVCEPCVPEWSLLIVAVLGADSAT